MPGVGPKSAQRLAYYLLRVAKEEALSLAEAIIAVRDKIGVCTVCHNFAEEEMCQICSDGSRERSRICVVEEPLDILAMERTRQFHGTYHVLHGALSPMAGIGPGELRIDALMSRLRLGGVDEVIVATNPTMEGDATSMYLAQLIGPLGIQVSRLARGLPMGGDLEYADEVTLTRALEGRRTM